MTKIVLTLRQFALFVCIFLPIFVFATSSGDLNRELQSATNQYYFQHHNNEAFSAVEVSVLLPGEKKPRNFVKGYQTNLASQ